MNRKQALLFSVGIVLLPIAATYGQPYAMGTAFTYQGQLEDDGSPANGQYDFEFKLCDDPVAACVLASTTVEDHQVDEGLFTVEVDFGADVFNGQARWLEMGVRPGGSVDPYTTLSPRQELTPSPHALRAKTGVGGPDALNVTTDDKVGIGTNSPTEELDVSGNIHASGTITSGSSITIDGVNDKIECPSTMELHVGGDRAFRLEPRDPAPNVIGGADNSAEPGVVGAAIGGGGTGFADGEFRCDAFPYSICGFCVGGSNDGSPCYDDYDCPRGTCQPDDSVCVSPSVCTFYPRLTCKGGPDHGHYCGTCLEGSNDGLLCVSDLSCPDGTCEPDDTACTSPGVCTSANPGNNVTAWYGTVGGGSGNTAAGNATVAGGELNAATGSHCTIAGGEANTADTIYDTVGGGDGNTASGPHATVGGGMDNSATGTRSTVGGGVSNTATGTRSTVGGGLSNTASGTASTLGGGVGNTASGGASTVPGGLSNTAAGSYSFAAGYRAKANHDGAFVWGDSTNADVASTGNDQFLIRAGGGVGIGKNDPSEQLDVEGNIHASGTITSGSSITIDGTAGSEKITSTADLELHAGGARALRIEPNASPNLIGGYSGNTVTGDVVGATISGGGSPICVNTITDGYGTIGGGRFNQAGDNLGTTWDATFATVGGGELNRAEGSDATVGGGEWNVATGPRSTIGGGMGNAASGLSGTIGGGTNNAASGGSSTVSGGFQNTASAGSATVPGGAYNSAAGSYSLAAGRRAKANNNGMFVWADQNDFDFPTGTEANFTPAADQFLARTTGGAVFVSGIDGTGKSTAGVQLNAGGGSWSSLSDRNAKANIDSVDRRAILRRLAQIPVSMWNYKSQDPSIRHIGPMAQDFHAAFGVGEKETMITTIDADGVALAAIQGLNEIVKEKDAQIGALKKRSGQLEERLAALEQIVGRLARQQEGGM